MHVVATAGHVDHGKSTLVRAVTGMEPDRLAEEHRRGLSIQLGYCWTTLPGVGEVAFVDVPGHERFLATTLAGIGSVPVVMFVVAADDPWMPQAAEHLAALDALGVDRGVLVVTRCDVAEPVQALRTAEGQLAGTSLDGLPAVTVSGRTGVGLGGLTATLADVLAKVPEPDPSAPVRLWVDRRFHVSGAGMVITGTLPAGRIAVGDTLELDGRPVRVRGLETLGRAASSAVGTARVALNLTGRATAELRPGSVLTSAGEFEAVGVLDVQLTRQGDRRLARQSMLHIGAAAVGCRVRPLGDDWARLALDRALPLRIGDRAILRDPGSRAMWGVRVLDPAPPSLRPRGSARARAAELTAFETGVGAEVARRGIVRASLLRRLGLPVAEEVVSTSSITRGSTTRDSTAWEDGAILRVGEWLVSAERAEQLRAALLEAVRAGPDPAGGLPVPAAARMLRLPDPGLVERLVEPPLQIRAGRVRDVEASEDLPAAQLAALEALQMELSRSPFAAPTADRLAELGLDRPALARLQRQGLLLRLDGGNGTVVLLPDAAERAVDRLKELPQPFSMSQARQALGSTRRVAIPLMSYLDRAGLTVRLLDDRRRLRC